MPRRLPRRDPVGRILDFFSRPHLPSYGEIAIGLLALAATYWLAQRQITLAERQLDIMERQDAIQNRRPLLQVVAERIDPPENQGRDVSVRYRLYVYNDGQAAARDFYITLLVDPNAFKLVNHFEVSGSQNAESVALNGTKFDARRALHDQPVYPKRRVVIGELMFLPKSREPVSLYWHVSAEDGVFPSTAQPGGIEVDGLFTSVVNLDTNLAATALKH